MRRHMTEQEIKDEVKYVAEHLEELKVSQQAERQAYFEDPANAARIAETRQRLAIAEQLYNRIRIHVPVELVPQDEARKKIFGTSRKPVRFFDLRASAS